MLLSAPPPHTHTTSVQSMDSAFCHLTVATQLHLPVQSHERLASSDSSSQHLALCCSAFSPSEVSWTTSEDKKTARVLWLAGDLNGRKVIHSGFAQTAFCVHFIGSGILNQQRPNVYTLAPGGAFHPFPLSWVSATSAYTLQLLHA